MENSIYSDKVECVAKRQRLEGSDAENLAEFANASEVVNLTFYGSTDCKEKSVSPEYTHQVFEQEIIPCVQKGFAGRVSININ